MIWHVDSVGGVQIIKSKQSHFTWKEEKHKLLDQKSGICHIFYGKKYGKKIVAGTLKSI